jgi:hypothetical protein
LQPGGHRFDPGQLHQKNLTGVNVVASVVLWSLVLSNLILSNLVLSDLVLRHQFFRRPHGAWWILMIPLMLVIIGAVVELAKMAVASRERKALIESGVDPDSVAKKAPTLR